VRRKTQPSLGKRRPQAIKATELAGYRTGEQRTQDSEQRTGEQSKAPVILSAAKDPNLT